MSGEPIIRDVVIRTRVEYVDSQGRSADSPDRNKATEAEKQQRAEMALLRLQRQRIGLATDEVRLQRQKLALMSDQLKLQEKLNKLGGDIRGKGLAGMYGVGGPADVKNPVQMSKKMIDLEKAGITLLREKVKLETDVIKLHIQRVSLLQKQLQLTVAINQAASGQDPSQAQSTGSKSVSGDKDVFRQLRAMADILREGNRLDRVRNRMLRTMAERFGRGNFSDGGSVSDSGNRRVGGRGANGQPGGIFGQGPLSGFNNLGFQLFITANSVKMVAGAVSGLASGGANFLNGTPGTVGGRFGDVFNNPRRDLEPGGIGHEFARLNQTSSFQNAINFLFPRKPGSTVDHFFGPEIGRAMSPAGRATPSRLDMFEQARQGLNELAKIEEMRSGKAIEAARTELELIKKRTELAREEFGLSTFEERQASFDIARKIKDRGLGTLTEQELEFVRGRQGFRGAVEKFSKSNADESGFSEFARLLGLTQEQIQKTQALQELQITVNVDGVSMTIEKAFEQLIEKFAGVVVEQANTAQQRFEGAVNKKNQAKESANPPAF